MRRCCTPLFLLPHPGFLQVTPLSLHINASLAAHSRDTIVRGVRWLGVSPRIATFTSEKAPHGFHNLLVVTDVRSGRSVPLRDRTGEAAPLLGVRASPSGAHLLALFKGAPAELWAVSDASFLTAAYCATPLQFHNMLCVYSAH
jgi:hypothetical protein